MRYLERIKSSSTYVSYLLHTLTYDTQSCRFVMSMGECGRFAEGEIEGVYLEGGEYVSLCSLESQELFLIKDSNSTPTTLLVKSKNENEENDTVTVAFDIMPHGIVIRAFVADDEQKPLRVRVRGVLGTSKSPEYDAFAMTISRDGRGLRAGYGPATSCCDNAVFDRANGRASVISDGVGGKKPKALRLKFDFELSEYTFACEDNTIYFHVKKNPFEDVYGISYAPINKKNTFPTPPAGWMTWYSVKFRACEDIVLKNAKMLRELFGEYGADSIWVDWEWYHSTLSEEGPENIGYFSPDPVRYPNGMAHVAKKIKENGQTPVLWVGFTHEPGKCELVKEHPEFILDDRVHWMGRYVFDATNKDYIEKYLIPAARKVREWGYDALKWDCLPSSMGVYDELHDKLSDPDVSAYDAMRNTVKTVRDVVGDDLYMLSCSGELDKSVLTYADLFDGARIGGDVFKWEEFIDSIVRRLHRLYSLHNTVLYCDPDNVVTRTEFNSDEQARTRVSLVSLLGLPFTIGDELCVLDDYRINLIRRALPPLDAHTMDIRLSELCDDFVVSNLAICKNFGEWNVVGVSNLSGADKNVNISIQGELYLDGGEYHVYDYWQHKYLGVYSGNIDVFVKSYDTAVFCVKRAEKRAQVLSTSRHISQGGYDLLSLSYDEKTRTFRGRSLGIKGEKYTVSIYDDKTDRVFDYEITPDATGEFEWSVTLK